jgi:hypothetical protein
VALDQLKNQKAGVLDFWTQRLVPVFDCFQPILRLWPWLARRLLHDYAIYAQAERLPDGDRPRYVVYGHTHHAEMVPLGSTDPQDRGRFYMNSGTWRTVWHQGNTLDGSRHFDAWKVMTYIAFYSPDEADGKHEFEMWDGSLRQRRP